MKNLIISAMLAVVPPSTLAATPALQQSAALAQARQALLGDIEHWSQHHIVGRPPRDLAARLEEFRRKARAASGVAALARLREQFRMFGMRIEFVHDSRMASQELTRLARTTAHYSPEEGIDRSLSALKAVYDRGRTLAGLPDPVQGARGNGARRAAVTPQGSRPRAAPIAVPSPAAVKDNDPNSAAHQWLRQYLIKNIGSWNKQLARIPQEAARIAVTAGAVITQSIKAGLDPFFVAAQMIQESRGNYNAVSCCGAKGLMQLMDGTARLVGVLTKEFDHRFQAQANLAGGIKYILQMLGRYGGDVALALAAYNAGPGNVRGRVPHIPETQRYVSEIMSRWNYLRRRALMETARRPVPSQDVRIGS